MIATIRAAIILLVALGGPVLAQQARPAPVVRAMPGEVRETRRTDGFMNKLEVELRLFGDLLAEAKGVRYSLTRAVDETGRNLIDPEKRSTEFTEIDAGEDRGVKLELELKNAARRATVVQEISGTLEVFVPRRDPQSIVLLSNALQTTGQPVASAALKTSGVEITIWTKEQYEARRKSEEERVKRELEERRKKAAESGEADLGEALAEGLMKVFGGMMSAFSELGANSVALQISDPQSKVIDLEFIDEREEPIKRQGRTTMGSDPKTMILEFERPLPAAARLRVFLLTPRAIVKTPFRLTNVPLP